MKTTMTIGAENFKKAVKAAVSCCGDGHAVSALSCVYMDIGRNGAFLACNLEQYVRCKFDTNVAGGEDTIGVCVDNDLLKKIASIKGDTITFTYDTDKDRELKLSNGKKVITLACYPVDNSIGSNDFNRESFSIPFEMDRTQVMNVECEELLTAVKNLSVFRLKIDSKPILRGYHFNGEDNMIETMDGYHCCRKNWKSGTMNSEYFETVAGCLDNIKNVFAKGDLSVEVFGVEPKNSKQKFGRYKYTMFKAVYSDMSIEYAVRNLDGEFHPMKQAYPVSFAAEGTVKANSLMEICKEYAKFISEKAVMPIIFHQADGIVYTGLRTPSVKLCDPTDIKMDGVFPTAGYKNTFLMDCLSVFDKNDIIRMRANGTLNPVLIENDEYHALVLPVRLKADKSDVEGIESDIALLNSKAV